MLKNLLKFKCILEDSLNAYVDQDKDCETVALMVLYMHFHDIFGSEFQ